MSAYYYLYRINGGEVVGASTSNSWPASDYFDVIGSDTLYDLCTPRWSDGNTIRSATEQEIAAFAGHAAEDAVAQQEARAEEIVDGTSADNPEARLDRALIETVRVELNTVRAALELAEYTVAEFKGLVKGQL